MTGAKEVFLEITSKEPDISRIKQIIETQIDVPAAHVDAAMRNIVLSANQRLFGPITKIELILVEGCNLACTYCFESKFLNPSIIRRKIMDQATIQRSIDLLFDYSGDAKNVNIVLFGGEPTLHMAGVRQTISYANRRAEQTAKSIRYDMTTNAVLFDEDMVRYLADQNVMVLVSIDGNRAVHDKYRFDKKGAGTFDAVLRGLDLLKKVQPWIGVKMTIMPDVCDQLFDSVVYLFERGVNQFVIGHATGVDWTSENLRMYALQSRYLRDWYHSVKEAGGDIRIAQFDDGDAQACGGKFGCSAGRNTIAVDAAGKITGCSRISTVEDHMPVGVLGDLDHGLYNLNMRMEMSGCATLRRNCASLGIDKAYNGGCFAMNFEENGDLIVPNIVEHDISLRINSANG